MDPGRARRSLGKTYPIQSKYNPQRQPYQTTPKPWPHAKPNAANDTCNIITQDTNHQQMDSLAPSRKYCQKIDEQMSQQVVEIMLRALIAMTIRNREVVLYFR